MYRRLIFMFFVLFSSHPSFGQSSDDSESYKSLETLARSLFYLENLYVDPDKVKRSEIVHNALKGVVADLDPHTVVLPSSAFKQLTIDTQGKFGGVGIIVSNEKGRLIVVSPIDGTPAARAGIQSGDEIVAIDGISVKELKAAGSTEKMRGPPNTELKLTIKRKGEQKELDFVLMREVIKVQSVITQSLGKGIYYARISSFQDNTTDELQKFLAKNKDQIKGFVLDLRDNPGGLLDQAVRVSDLFIESGLIVSTVGRGQKDVEREFASKRGTFSSFPLTVLINSGSASASEIVAGALQDHERALVIGTTSFGKGSVQTLISLPDRSGLKITVARYYTPKDRSIQARGIEPDVYITENLSKPNKQSTKEVDLAKHMVSHDLSDLAKNSGLKVELEAWPDSQKKDRQLLTAYTYLRGWNKFQKNR